MTLRAEMLYSVRGFLALLYSLEKVKPFESPHACSKNKLAGIWASGNQTEALACFIPFVKQFRLRNCHLHLILSEDQGIYSKSFHFSLDVIVCCGSLVTFD